MGLRMSLDLCAAAARTNAIWCDAMARLHGTAGAFVAEARWIHRAAGAFGTAAAGAQRVTDAATLALWERAWCANEVHVERFPPALLDAADHAVIAAMQDGAIVGGCIASRSDGVLGISNLFAPDAPLVGYEHGDSLARMTELGFRETGRLRVWQAPR